MTSQTLVTVLLVDDDEDYYLLAKDMLERQVTARYVVDWCPDFRSGLEAMERADHDVYLVDYQLGTRTGIELLRLATRLPLRSPVIVLAADDDRHVDLEAMDAGVAHLLVKSQLSAPVLERSIRYALSQHRATSALVATQDRYELAARASNDGIWEWDGLQGTVYYSPRWNALLGLEPTEVVGTHRRWLSLVHPDDVAGLRLATEAHLTGRTSVLEFKHRMRHANGEWRWILSRGLAVSDTSGEPTRMAGSISDITAAHRAELTLRHAALQDPLTRIPNRALLTDRLERALLRMRYEPGYRCAVLLVDVDRLSLVNETLGHAIGDEILVAVARRLSEAVGPHDTVARFSGDEFVVLLDDLGHGRPGRPYARARQVAGAVSQALNGELRLGGHSLFVNVCLGIAIAEAGDTADETIRNAYVAMCWAKGREGPRAALYHRGMGQHIANRLASESELRKAVEQALIGLHYQPVVDLRTGRLHGFEALARWDRPECTTPPSEFIPIAEETGLIHPLGRQVIDIALTQLRSWTERGLVDDSVRISINVSGRQLDHPDFPDHVLAALEASGLPGRCIGLEITEGTLMRQPERISRVVEEVCGAGISLELDDFGTGYSSLSALRTFPVSALKIDRSFVSSIDTDGDALARSIVGLGHNLGLQVVAEGIEDARQLQRLRYFGCGYGQGFLLSPPLPAGDIERRLAQWSAEGLLPHRQPGS